MYMVYFYKLSKQCKSTLSIHAYVSEIRKGFLAGIAAVC